MMRAVLLLALAVLVVSACRETSETAPSTAAGPVSTPLSPATPSAASTPEPGVVLSATPTTATHPPSAATATPVSQRSGRLAIATRVVLEDLDVHRASAPSLAAFGPGIVYSRLLRFASGPDVRTPSLALECDLCESWVWEDSATLRVTLRQGVRWQSAAPVNGRALSPHDVTASLMRQRTAGLAPRRAAGQRRLRRGARQRCGLHPALAGRRLPPRAGGRAHQGAAFGACRHGRPWRGALHRHRTVGHRRGASRPPLHLHAEPRLLRAGLSPARKPRHSRPSRRRRSRRRLPDPVAGRGRGDPPSTSRPTGSATRRPASSVTSPPAAAPSLP